MIKEDVRLYHEDGRGIFKNISRPEIEKKESYYLNVKNADYRFQLKQF